MCSGWSGGSARLSSGQTMKMAAAAALNASQLLGPYNRCKVPWGTPPFMWSCLYGPALEGEHALRAFLNEENNEHQHHDFGDHGARPRFKQFVDDTKTQGGVNGAGQLPDAAQNDDHERIDDICLAKVGTDVADLRQCTPCETGDAGTQ